VKPVLAKASCLVLTNVLRGHPLFKLFNFKILLEPALAIPSHFNVVVFKPFLQNGLIDVGELPFNVIEVNSD
jgi:hypothetical protein